MPATAGATDDLEIELASKILLKVLLLDDELAKKTDGKIVIGVTGSPAALAAFRQLRGIPIDRAEKFTVEHVVPIESFPPNARFTFVFVGPGADIAKATRYTRSKGVLSATNVPDLVEKGVTLGVGLENNKPKVLLNLTGSERERLKWDTKILKISRKFRSP